MAPGEWTAITVFMQEQSSSIWPHQIKQPPTPELKAFAATLAIINKLVIVENPFISCTVDKSTLIPRVVPYE
jgi:hypothetical protein